jgi:HPt (histidine-containing phosphotransfer) domain-containing protein
VEEMGNIINKEQLLENFSGDEEILKEIVESYLDANSKTLMAELAAAIEKKTAKEIEHAAHTIKGVVSNFACPSCVDKAFELESMGRSGELDGAEVAFSELKELIDALNLELEALIKDI